MYRSGYSPLAYRYASPSQSPDATLDFASALNDPRRWVIKQGVPIFKCHQRVDPNTGKVITVDLPKLYRIAQNMAMAEQWYNSPARVTLGHTEPGKPEVQQPPVAAWHRFPRVQPFGAKGEPAIVVDEWLDPTYAPYRKNYPHRSAEYYDDTEEIKGVALLTRDPYLDLGIVAYSMSAPGVVHYSRAGEQPTCYHVLLGVEPMWPDMNAQNMNGAPFATMTGFTGQPVAPVAPVPYVYSPQMQPQFPAAYGQPAPALAPQPYAAFTPQGRQYPSVPAGFTPQQQPTARYGSWQGQGAMHQPHNIGHQHPSGGAIYGPQHGGGMGHPMHHAGYGPQVGGPMTCPHCGMPIPMEEPAPQSPFPPGQQNLARTGYSNPTTPALTLSGLPVGYQMRMDQLQYQLNEGSRAIQVLLQERDQQDTAVCYAEIRRLATMGYPVSEFEVGELKNRPPEARAAYLQHIETHYQKVPTDNLPPMLGDPSPGPMSDNQNRPLSQDEMKIAFKISSANPSIPWPVAMQYARQSAGNPMMAMAASMPNLGAAMMGGAPGGMPYAMGSGMPPMRGMGGPQPMPNMPMMGGNWGVGQPAPAPMGAPMGPMGNPMGGGGFQDPYPEPNMYNGGAFGM